MIQEEKTNINELKKLYWKTDSEKIKELISTLPTKYLIGRINTCKRDCNMNCKKKDSRIVVINWKGFTFTASQKTLENELLCANRRSEIYCRWNFDNPIGRICRTYHFISKEKHQKEKSIKRR
jgi:hypothetical protein